MRKIVGILKQKYKSKYKQVGLWFMAYGMPNVGNIYIIYRYNIYNIQVIIIYIVCIGKSSILNQLRNISDL